MTLSQEQQKQLAMVVVAMVMFGYVYMARFLKPLKAEIQTKEAELASVNSRIEGLRATASQRDQLLKRVEELKVLVSAVEKRLPRDRNLQDIIRLVSELATQNGVHYSVFEPQVEQTSQLFIELPINLKISGTVLSVSKLMAALGQQERILSVRNLTLNFMLDSKKNRTVSGQFTLVAFVYNG